MRIAFDPDKDVLNRKKHGVSLSDFAGFDAEPRVVVDDRHDYGEVRYQARGLIDGQPFCLVYAETLAGIRLISLRRAHQKEMQRHG